MTFTIDNDQKQILLQKISEVVETYRAQSLLDIGAGQSSLALQLAQKVKRYVAIESNFHFAKQLRAAGLSVIEGAFPTIQIQGTYDLVLSSHSIPEQIELYKLFLTKAWELVAPRGLLIVITFKGVKDELFALTNRFRKDWDDPDVLKYDELIRILSTFGEVKVEKITSHSSSKNIKGLLDVLVLSIGGSEAEKETYRSELRHIVEEKYKSVDKYVFPHEHLVFSVRRN